MNRRGAVNGFLIPLLVAGAVSVAAVAQGVTQDLPILLVAPSVVIGGILLFLVRKVVDMEKTVAAALPLLQRHDKHLDDLAAEAATVDQRIGETRHLLRGEFQKLHLDLEQDYREHLDTFHPRQGP